MARLVCFVMVLAAFAGCEKKKLPEEPNAVPVKKDPVKKNPVVKAPSTVPKSLEALFNQKWPLIEKEGADFTARFNEASAAKKADDRDTLDTKIAEANKHFIKLADMWAEIAYGFDEDGPEADACRRFLSPYEKRVKTWSKKNKGLKELSRAK